MTNRFRSVGRYTTFLFLGFVLFPGVAYASGTFLLSRFQLNEREHAAIRQALDARRETSSSR